MNIDVRYEKLAELLKDAEVMQQLFSYTPEEAVVALKEEYQLDFTLEELNDIALGIKAAIETDHSDELSFEQLEEVVGGGKSGAYYTGYYIGKTVIAASVIIGGIAGAVALGW